MSERMRGMTTEELLSAHQAVRDAWYSKRMGIMPDHELLDALGEARREVLADIAELEERYRKRGLIFHGAFVRSLLEHYQYSPASPRPATGS